MHYLVTRFSVGNPSDEWLKHRWPLFERCAASVAAQDCEFEWLLLCHKTMDKKWFDKLEFWFKDSNVKIIKVGNDWLNSLQRYLNNGFDAEIITTRLDSDDELGPRFLASVQMADSSSPNYFVDAPHGWKEVDGELKEYTEQNNPFLSFVETQGPFRSAYHVEHGSRINKYVVVRIKGRHWIQVIHDRNLRNKA